MRRSLLLAGPAFLGLGVTAGLERAFAGEPDAPAAIHDTFPRFDPAVVMSFVGLCHRDPVEIRRMVEAQPSLARASWDWGFGDWETGLGAASHTGGREIASLLLAHGAHPTLFSAAMLGQLDVVKAITSASPGIQKTLGPHGLTLLHHARVGGKDAAPVVAFLEALGDADTRPRSVPLEPADRDAVVGRYRFGKGEKDVFEVDVKNDLLGIVRTGGTRRILSHTGDLAFFPSGVPSVRIAFARANGRVARFTIADPAVFLTAEREA